MKHRSFATSITVLSLAVSGQLYADTQVSGDTQQSVQTTKQLAPIVTTATRSAQSIAEIAGTVQSIDQAQIQQQAAAGRKIADILAQLIPSLSPSSGTTSNYGQTMRGRQVLVMVDGVALTGSRDVSRQLNSISPSSIEKIEVVSGASSIYGSGATGGIINIITKQAAKDGLNFETKLGVTSGNNFNHDALAYEAYQSVAFKQDDLSGFLGAGYTQRGEIQDSHGDRIGPEIAQTDRQDTKTVDVNGRLSWQMTNNQKLSFGTQYYEDKQDSDYGPDYGPNYAVLRGAQPSLKAIKGLELDDQPFTKRYSVNAQYQNTDFLGQELNIETYYRNEKARFFPALLTNFIPYNYYLAYQSESDIDVAGIRAAVTSKFNVANRNLGLTYGIDYDHEKDKQTADLYSFSNNGLKYTSTGRSYDFGPEATIKNLGAFIQSNYEVSNALNLQAGIRYQRIDSDTESFKPTVVAIQGDLLGQPVASVAAGSVDHDKTLFNLGAVYKFNDQQQVFANFSQGFSLPDIQRVLRDVSASYVVRSGNVDPITVNSYELGWRLQGEDGLNLGLTGFYNTSDKVVQFNTDRTVTVADTDQRIYGAEANITVPVVEQFTVGGTLSYTRGQYKDSSNEWRELNALQISPVKGTVFGEWNDGNGNSLRVQTLAIKGSNKAYNDSLEATYNANVRPNTATKIKGYAVMDVIANAKVGPSTLGFGVYNVWNTDYKTVYSQAVVPVYGAISSLPAQGRTYGLSYSVKY
ncbi:TonB-dependent receptor [Acinetobacter ursingii]|uniref:TonB-dependent receptor n=1 Tax=Acinetobacter ursingii TaxID=108980 RepID=A0AA46S7J5_9GAMM|nr:TonB-dependent receptor [Acinetobacter ursingii]MCU4487719.1 TonB-dependent receptor [Acinetobacter ursingii]MCU4495817.1 TonB-dependent receptor [Acinetobacter ursingii]MCU4603279.1 TonB-dependent receptor [Acinetobacter ursingii]MDA3580102.1 TonB-dependent receptor [Acinetobacter ursingii]MDG9858571.1 TonB-dependent receptor [Acinetobacter ursingii]